MYYVLDASGARARLVENAERIDQIEVGLEAELDFDLFDVLFKLELVLEDVVNMHVCVAQARRDLVVLGRAKVLVFIAASVRRRRCHQSVGCVPVAPLIMMHAGVRLASTTVSTRHTLI